MPRRRSVDDMALECLLRSDARVATHQELKALGFAASTITFRIRHGGPWTRLLPGVVLAQTGPPSTRQRLIGAMKYAGADSVISGAAALRLHGFRSVPTSPDALMLVSHTHHRSSSGYVVTERTIRRPPCVVRDGLVYADVPRAVVDTSRKLRDLDSVRAVVAEAVQTGKCRANDLAAEIRACARQGSALPRRVLAEISAGIRSVAEAKARAELLKRRIPQPEWNVEVEDENGVFIAMPDGYWEDLAAALEIDSMRFHLSPQDYQRTQQRQRRMTSYGILVIPVAPTDIIDDPAAFGHMVERTLAAAALRPTPPVRVRRNRAA